jgi:hypothetical protein
MTVLQKITMGLNIAAIIISAFAIIKSYRALKMSKKALDDSNKELENLRDKWSIYGSDKLNEEIDIDEDDDFKLSDTDFDLEFPIDSDDTNY